LNSDTILYLRRNPSDPDELKDNMEYTITEAEPWVDGTWVKPGKYPVIDTRVKEGYITIVADTYDDKVGTLLHAVDQQVIVNTNKNKLQEEIFEGQYVDTNAHYNPLKPISEERIKWEEKIKYIIGSEWDMDGSDVDGLLMVPYREELLDDAWNNKQSAEYTAEKIMSIENPGEGDTVETGYDWDDWDDYVEDIVTRYDAGQYKEAFDLYREYCRGKSPEDIARFYKALEERDVDYQTLLRKGRSKLNPGIPTKEFWDKMYPKIFKRYKKKYRSKSKAEEIARQVVGSIWYHKMGRDAKDRYERIRKYREAKANPEKTYDYDEHDNGWGWKCPVCEDEYGLLPQHYTFKTQDEAYQDVLKHLLTEHPEDIKDIENEYGPKLKSMTTGETSLFVPMFGRSTDPDNDNTWKDWTW
jgi:hypothetical protein